MSIFERVIPVLVYSDIPAAHDFLVKAFGFTAGQVERDTNGVPVHGEVRLGETTIWLHRFTAEHQLGSPESVNMSGNGIVVFVSDVDAHCIQAQAAGALIQSEPTDQGYGQREYEARDLEGHRWWFATPTQVPTPS